MTADRSVAPPPVPRVSAIINAYNGAAYLRDALDSVRAQTWTDWELILFDDQSTDDTAEIFHGYDDPRFRYVRPDRHLPLGRARHAAVLEARGEWLGFLDQDDIWAPWKLARQLAAAEDGGDRVGLVCGRGVRFHPDGRTRHFDSYHATRPLPEKDVLVALLRHGVYFPMSAALIRREAYFDVGGVPDDIELAVDSWLFAALAERFEVRAVQDVCCWYRMHDANTSVARSVPCYEEALRVVERFGGALDPRMLARRVRVWNTLIGFEEMRKGRMARGIGRILRRGSLPYLLTRPFSRALRALGPGARYPGPPGHPGT